MKETVGITWAEYLLMLSKAVQKDWEDKLVLMVEKELKETEYE